MENYSIILYKHHLGNKNKDINVHRILKNLQGWTELLDVLATKIETKKKKIIKKVPCSISSFVTKNKYYVSPVIKMRLE